MRCFGIVGHLGDQVHGLQTLCLRDGCFGGKSGGKKVGGRRDRRYRGFTSVGVRSGEARFRSGLEQDGGHFGARYRRRERRVKARSRGKPKGATGEPDVATRPASNGLLAGTPLWWGRLSDSGLASVSLPDGRRANHERGRASGERPSNRSVTVSTSSGGERFEGSAPVRSVGLRR